MARHFQIAAALLAVITSLGGAFDDIAWRDVGVDGRTLESRNLDLPVARAPGADNFFLSNPMDSHDWSHTTIVKSSLSAVVNGSSAKVQKLQDALAPLFAAMPKDAAGRLEDGTARYALHRYFSEKHGWTIKGLEPAGASWMKTMSVDSKVRDVNKYMLPSYLQQLLSQRLGAPGFDLHSLAVLGAVIEHMTHAEMIHYVQSIFSTLGFSTAGKRTEKQVDEVLDTFMMVFAFGMNLDVSSQEDIQIAKASLEKTHPGWSQLRNFAQGVKKGAFQSGELDFAEVLQVAEKISEGYSKWQASDCSRVMDELVAKPNHREGRVPMSAVTPSVKTGRRSFLMETQNDLWKSGVLDSSLSGSSNFMRGQPKLVIPNYLNSQNMCLSTASFFTVCCPNECDSLLASLERQVGGPTADSAQFTNWASALNTPGAFVQQINGLVEPSSDRIHLHGHKLASWMHHAFPLKCPAPLSWHGSHPKTPNEWIEDSGKLEVNTLEEEMTEVAQVLRRYTSMGGNASATKEATAPATDAPRVPLFTQSPTVAETNGSSLLNSFLRLGPLCPMLALVAYAFKSLQQATCMCLGNSDQLSKGYKFEKAEV